MKSTRTWSLLCQYLWIVLYGSLLTPSLAFAPRPLLVSRKGTSLNGGTDDLMESLRARQQQLESQQNLLDKNWRTAKCQSSIPVALPDWIRRIDLEYPLVACGSSSGSIFVAHVETGEVLAQSSPSSAEELDDIDSLLHILFGAYDGGGTLAIAVHRNLICSAGRQGSVQIHRFDKATSTLMSQGSMQALEGVLVTCLQMDEDHVWIGTSDGRILAYPHSDSDPDTILSLQTEPSLSYSVSSPILSLSITPSIGYGVATTAKGTVEMFSMEDDAEGILACWYPPFDTNTRQSSNTYPLSATLVATENDGYSVACGASDGSLYLHPLEWKNESFSNSPLVGKVKECIPKHQGPVKCLTSPRPSLLISGGQDGAIRAWNTSEAICLYQFMGYKVWLGSLWTDGVRLVSDGADNTIVAHNFEEDVASNSSGRLEEY